MSTCSAICAGNKYVGGVLATLQLWMCVYLRISCLLPFCSESDLSEYHITAVTVLIVFFFFFPVIVCLA